MTADVQTSLTTSAWSHPRPRTRPERWPDLAPPAAAPVRAAVARSLLARSARRVGVRVELPGGQSLGAADGPVLRVHNPDFLTRLGRDGKIGFGEAFMAGDWDADDVVAVLTPFAREMGTLVHPRLQWLRHLYDPRQPDAEDNSPDGSRRNISRHYDLSNELFEQFLDESMTYSAALFGNAGRDDLATAQRRKVDRLLDVTGVGPGTRLLEIGTGWGELALRAARRGATVTSITLSAEQAAYARRRVQAAGVSDRVEILLQDYREVAGRYDAVVSVEMVEAVGARWWPTYFSRIESLLAPGGRAGLQAIVMPHDRMLATRDVYTWIHKYVFPGGMLPSERAIDEVLDAHTGLAVTDRFPMGMHYAETLRHWRERFLARAHEVDALGFDHAFRRMWEFYLAYCEAGFRASYLDVVQLVLQRSSR